MSVGGEIRHFFTEEIPNDKNSLRTSARMSSCNFLLVQNCRARILVLHGDVTYVGILLVGGEPDCSASTRGGATGPEARSIGCRRRCVVAGGWVRAAKLAHRPSPWGARRHRSVYHPAEDGALAAGLGCRGRLCETVIRGVADHVPAPRRHHRQSLRMQRWGLVDRNTPRRSHSARVQQTTSDVNMRTAGCSSASKVF
jgi:hypothetical protein